MTRACGSPSAREFGFVLMLGSSCRALRSKRLQDFSACLTLRIARTTAPITTGMEISM